MSLGQVKAAWPVAAGPIKSAASAANWLLGRGTPLAVDGGHGWIPGSDDTQSKVLRYKFHLDAVHTTYGVFIVASCANPFVPVSINGTTYTIGNNATIIHFGLPNIGGDADVEIALTFQWAAGDVVARNTLEIHNVQIYESPVIFLATSGAGGIEPGTLVYDGHDDRESIAGLERAVEDLRTLYFRRGTLFNWTSGYEDGMNGAAATNTSYEDLTPLLDPAIQTRIMYGELTRPVKVAVCADVSGGTGNIRVTMTSGDTHTFNITATTPTWIVADLDVETDDPELWESDGGTRGGLRDDVRFEYRAGSGQNLSIYAISIWDPPGD